MIWVCNAVGGRAHGTEQTVIDGVCYCADCMVEQSNGLLTVGSPAELGDFSIKELIAMGLVGIYRMKAKPWKRK